MKQTHHQGTQGHHQLHTAWVASTNLITHKDTTWETKQFSRPSVMVCKRAHTASASLWVCDHKGNSCAGSKACFRSDVLSQTLKQGHFSLHTELTVSKT